jgi:hypothetical protein
VTLADEDHEMSDFFDIMIEFAEMAVAKWKTMTPEERATSEATGIRDYRTDEEVADLRQQLGRPCAILRIMK